jgi:hypothetical protein
VIVDQDNNSTPGQNGEDETLRSAWVKTEESEREAGTQAPDTFRSNKEPQRGLEPLRIDLVEDRFEYLRGKTLVKEEKAVQRYRHVPMEADANQMLTGLGTGQGTWGASNLLLTKLTTVQSPVPKRQAGPVLPASMETFVQAIELLAEQRPCEVGLIGVSRGDTIFGAHTLATFPTRDPRKGKSIAWDGSKKKTAQDVWPLPRSVQKIRLLMRSKLSGLIRNTPFSSLRARISKKSARWIGRYSC